MLLENAVDKLTCNDQLQDSKQNHADQLHFGKAPLTVLFLEKFLKIIEKDLYKQSVKYN